MEINVNKYWPRSLASPVRDASSCRFGCEVRWQQGQTPWQLQSTGPEISPCSPDHSDPVCLGMNVCTWTLFIAWQPQATRGVTDRIIDLYIIDRIGNKGTNDHPEGPDSLHLVSPLSTHSPPNPAMIVWFWVHPLTSTPRSHSASESKQANNR